MTNVRRALALSIGERYLLIVAGLVSNVILARLLTPEQIGIYSVSVAVAGIAQVLRDFGIASFLIQERHLREAHVRTAFGLSLVIGSALFAIVFCAATRVGNFYGEPRLVSTMRIGAFNFLVLPFCTVSLALLRREMQFDRLVMVTISSSIIGVLATLTLARVGWGPDSMAAGSVATNVVTGIGSWIARGAGSMLLPSLKEWRHVVRFGGQSALAGVVTTIAIDVNDLVLGRILGFAPVAVISRAQGMMNLFHRDLTAALRSVAFPAFARALREGEAVEPGYAAAVGAITVFAWPFYGFVAAFPLELLRLLFGPQWDAAAPLVVVFCAAGAIAATSSLVFALTTAAGRIDLVTKAELAFQPLRVAMIVSSALVFRSLFACAVAYLAAFVLHTPLAYWVKGRWLRTNWHELLAQLQSSAKVAALALLGPFAIAMHAGLGRSEPTSLTDLCAAAVLLAAGWLIGIRVFRHALVKDPLYLRVAGRLSCKASRRT